MDLEEGKDKLDPKESNLKISDEISEGRNFIKKYSDCSFIGQRIIKSKVLDKEKSRCTKI